MDLDLDLESLAADLDLSDLWYLLAQDSSGEETVVDLPAEQVRRVVDLWDYGPSAERDIQNPDDLRHVLIR